MSPGRDGERAGYWPPREEGAHTCGGWGQKAKADAAAAVTLPVIFSFNKVSGIDGL